MPRHEHGEALAHVEEAYNPSIEILHVAADGIQCSRLCPEPLDEQVRIRKEPGRLMAAVRYSGTWSEEAYEKNKALLETYIQKRGLKKAGVPVWARYDPPFMPWFLRRNEVLIPVEKF